MPTLFHRFAPLLAICCAAAITGCSSFAPAKVRYRDRGFTAEQIQAGGLMFGAVTLSGTGEYELAAEVAQQAQAAFAELRPTLKLVPLAETRAGIPATQYQAALKKLGEDGPEALDIQLFRQAHPSVRYFFWASVGATEGERGATLTEHREVTTFYDYRRERAYSFSEVVGYQATDWAAREATGEFAVIDLHTGRLVWSASSHVHASDVHMDYSRVGLPRPEKATTPGAFDSYTVLCIRGLKALPK